MENPYLSDEAKAWQEGYQAGHVEQREKELAILDARMRELADAAACLVANSPRPVEPFASTTRVQVAAILLERLRRALG